MSNFATVEDMEKIWRRMTTDEKARAEELIPLVSDSLRVEAYNVGKDLDCMIVDLPALARVAKSVTVDVVARALMTSTNEEPMIQTSESALGYAISGTHLVPGGGLFIKKSELARLGLRRQRKDVIELWACSEE